VEIVTNARQSLEGLLKSVIDGLEPFLGRDSRGRLEFVPNDDLIVDLTIRRQREVPITPEVTAGPAR
jgi:hypothetical protein